MFRTARTLTSLTLFSAGLAAMSGCATSPASGGANSALTLRALEDHKIDVVEKTEFLEIAIDPYASELSSEDRARLKRFVGDYVAIGHGPLVLSMPQSSANPQLAVAAVAEARAIAWEEGVEYSEIAGSAHGAGSARAEPMIVAFQRYEALRPDCPFKSTVDFANASSNSYQPTLGCSVRTNLAAMISDPADLLGQRPLDAADNPRVETILKLFREGKSTASQRSNEESGEVSTAIK